MSCSFSFIGLIATKYYSPLMKYSATYGSFYLSLPVTIPLKNSVSLFLISPFGTTSSFLSICFCVTPNSIFSIGIPSRKMNGTLECIKTFSFMSRRKKWSNPCIVLSAFSNVSRSRSKSTHETKVRGRFKKLLGTPTNAFENVVTMLFDSESR